ncbi:cytochrome c oxidase cbb3-type subunit 2 [Chryseobacterium bernardetii]|uniref:Cytochrome c oxidase cbb3-type subunit 2 n=3 Tax=Chryseobacterium TaxID=59732 RepID=A0A543EFY2_9FLAO|nr:MULTISPECIES: cbb3-type cytochrome c oxidase subunit II [Chryseobacterium]MDR6370531.1 cytochrome c oxidase cbb3-type subunit 2 [Chryseobacterium vietnamense]MDR6441537.1 cytochrome c oxidase cbb3-type subunit 2 [Chryseobacterium bernardetii]MDR6456979.1 cytochrome c oxidase cbb3-type subunit 2 [Chryseobacterium vietnamense]TQM20491.1 cytochrome c oxidase cbb3-type subunit 2 [Chryseobacterium aquifrigidense]
MIFLNDHRILFGSALLLFVSLTLYIAILPALDNQRINKPLPRQSKILTKEEQAGKRVYIDNGCIACHTQQVRNVEMDNVFGKRPSIPADFAINTRTDFWRNTANLMGTQRTGPDLTSIGERQPSAEWHLIHLYQPRAAVEESVMPAYPWLFIERDYLQPGDVEVKVPEKFRPRYKKIVAGPEALLLVAYLKSLKQTDYTDKSIVPAFLYKQKKEEGAAQGGNAGLPDGDALFTANCASCHQANGEGVPGAFPPLKGSPVVAGGDLELYVTIIMKGYDPRPEFATMPPVGTNANFTPEDVAAIMNHERTSWGNNAKKVTAEEVKTIMDKIK